MSPALLAHIRQEAANFDFFLFFSVRYYHAYHGARLVPDKAILVPTAERDGALGLEIFAPLFRGVRALMYNSFEERALIQTVSGNHEVPGVVVGIGSEIPAETNASRFRQKFNLRDRFAIYVGRIDENKGCAELFDFFQRYSRMLVEGMHLVLIGNPIIPIPDHPQIHHLGFVSDQDKFDAIAASELLIMPSYLESLSMVALEVLGARQARARQRPLRRAEGPVHPQQRRALLRRASRSSSRRCARSTSVRRWPTALGRNGRDYFTRHYSWPVIERKYLDMLERLKAGSPARADGAAAGMVGAAEEVAAAGRSDRGQAADRAGAGSGTRPRSRFQRATRSRVGLRIRSLSASRRAPREPRDVRDTRDRAQEPARRDEPRGQSAGRPPRGRERSPTVRSASALPGAAAGRRPAGSGERRPSDRRPMRNNRRPGGRPRRPGNR